MNWTEKLKEILSWIGSHSQRMSRKGLDLPNHLAYARVHFFKADTHTPEPIFSDVGLERIVPYPIVLNGQGRLSHEVHLKPDQLYRVEVKDNIGEILFTEDNIEPT